MARPDSSIPEHTGSGQRTDPPGSWRDQLGVMQRFHLRLMLMYGGAMVVLLGLMSMWSYRLALDSEMNGLQQRMAMVALSLSETLVAEDLAAFDEAEDYDTPEYRALREELRTIASRDPDIYSVYVLRSTGGEPGLLEFVADYTDAEDEPIKPGDAYDARPLPKMMDGLRELAVEDEIARDEFGWSLSAYAPLYDSARQPQGVLGVDVQASRLEVLKARVLLTTVVVFGLALVVLTVLTVVVGHSISRPLEAVIDASDAIAHGDLDVRVTLGRQDEFGLLGKHFDTMVEGLQEREFIRQTFGRYVSDDVVAAILRDRDLKLGGEERVVTILFSDLRGYSTILEQLGPAEAVALVNEYLGEMAELVESHEGNVIEFIGDAVLAVFGAPLDVEEHQAKAVACAVAMQRRLAELNQGWEASGRARVWQELGLDVLTARIGIHTGAVIAGNLGSRTRMKYGVIGDNVNVAARLEQLNKELGTAILVSGETWTALEPGSYPEDPRGSHRVKGRDTEVEVWAV